MGDFYLSNMKIAQSFLILISFTGLTLLIYFPTHQSGFVTDFYGWQYMFAGKSFYNAINTFGWHANQQFSSLLMFGLYQLFQVNGWGWYLAFSIMHGLNGWLMFLLFKKLLVRQKISSAALIAIVASLLFLLSPYAAEVLVWRVCFHYIVSGFLILSILLLAIRYFETSDSRWVLWAQFLFVLSLFTLEMALVTPLLIIAIVLWWHSGNELNRMRSKIARLIIPQFVLIGFYFCLNKLVIHDWMGHYGSDVHLHFKLADVLSNYFHYAMKYLFFSRYLDYAVEKEIFGLTEGIAGIAVFSVIFLLLFILFIIFYKRLPVRIQSAGCCWILFSVALIPIITLYMVTLLHGENDRYGYIASMFFWMIIILLISSLPKKIFYPLSTALIVISILLSIKMVGWWEASSKIYYSLLQDFRWYGRDQVIVLNIPDNYQGLYLYRIYNDPSALKEGLELIRGNPYTGDMHDVVNFNMMTPQDSVSIRQDSANSVTLHFAQYGNWWWRNGIGASDYENDIYSVHFDGDCHIHFKNLLPDHVIIYQAGDKWREFEMK